MYIDVEDGLRLERALSRERTQQTPKYAEMCRRFLADAEDFSQEKLADAGIEKAYANVDFQVCLEEILLYIRDNIWYTKKANPFEANIYMTKKSCFMMWD